MDVYFVIVFFICLLITFYNDYEFTKNIGFLLLCIVIFWFSINNCLQNENERGIVILILILIIYEVNHAQQAVQEVQ